MDLSDTTTPNEAGFKVDDAALVKEVQRRVLVTKWLNNMPSSQSSLSDIHRPDSPNSNAESQKTLVRDFSPEMEMTTSLQSVPSVKIPPNDGHSQAIPGTFTSSGQPFTSFWNSSQSQLPLVHGKSDEKPAWTERFRDSELTRRTATRSNYEQSCCVSTGWFNWFKALPIFHWFSKDVQFPSPESPESNDQNPNGPNNQPFNDNLLYPFVGENEPVVFRPFHPPCTEDGMAVPASLLFGCNDVRDQVTSAVQAITTKIHGMDPQKSAELCNMPNIGCSDGEVRFGQSEAEMTLNSLNLNVNVMEAQAPVTPSVEELRWLAEQVKNLSKDKKSTKMKSIFGIRDVTRGGPHPLHLVEVLETRERTPSWFRRAFTNLSSIFGFSPGRERRVFRLGHDRVPDLDLGFVEFAPPPEDLEEPDNNNINNNNNDNNNEQFIPPEPIRGRSVSNVFRQALDGFRGLLRGIGWSQARVAPDNQLQEQQEQPRRLGGSRRRHRRIRRSHNEMRELLPPPGFIPRNPIRRRNREEYPRNIFEPLDLDQGLNGMPDNNNNPGL